MLHVIELALEIARYGQHVAALAHYDDGTDHLTGTVEVRNAAPQVVAHLKVTHVLEQYWVAIAISTDDEALELIETAILQYAPDLVIAICNFDGPATDLIKCVAKRIAHSREAETLRLEQRREEFQLELFFEPSDRCDLGDAWHRLQCWLDQALMEQTQLTQIAGLSLVDDRILINPAHAARIGAEDNARVTRQRRTQRIQTARDQLPALLPPNGAIQGRIDEGVAHVRGRTDGLDAGRAQQCLHDRIGDLGLEQRWAALPFRVDDDLRVCDVGDRIERRDTQRIQARERCQRSEAQDDATKADDAADKGVNRHRGLHR